MRDPSIRRPSPVRCRPSPQAEPAEPAEPAEHIQSERDGIQQDPQACHVTRLETNVWSRRRGRAKEGSRGTGLA